MKMMFNYRVKLPLLILLFQLPLNIVRNARGDSQLDSLKDKTFFKTNVDQFITQNVNDIHPYRVIQPRVEMTNSFS